MKLIQKPKKINRQIVGVFIVIMLISLTICFILNSCFLGDFYLLHKQMEMRSVFSLLESKSEEGILYDEDTLYGLYTVCQDHTVGLLIEDDNHDKDICANGSYEFLHNHLVNIFGDYADCTKVLKVYDKYTMLTEKCPNAGESYLILTGKLDNGSQVYIQCAIDGVRQSANVANIFLLWIYLFAIVIASIIGYILISYFTRPLFNMIDITKRISNFDFTAKYQAQNIYNELDDLGEHVNEMSTSLERAIQQLQKANESLKHDLEIREETENMRKEFISSVSHELKTPIALIQGYAEGLQEGIMDDENSRQIYLDVILDEANKMNRLVREMLILNQLEAGQMSADFDDFDVTNIVNGIIESNQIYFEGQEIQLNFPNNEPCMVYADEVLVEQVFTNFMSNAIHYVMNENIITVRYEFAKKGKVRISVFNTGNTIPKKDIKHIWDKFYKVDKARSREYGGSGIGLSVVKAIMELMNEKFGVENLSNGVEFWFELSLSKPVKTKQNS